MYEVRLVVNTGSDGSKASFFRFLCLRHMISWLAGWFDDGLAWPRLLSTFSTFYITHTTQHDAVFFVAVAWQCDRRGSGCAYRRAFEKRVYSRCLLCCSVSSSFHFIWLEHAWHVDA